MLSREKVLASLCDCSFLLMKPSELTFSMRATNYKNKTDG
jgi:hypothetical protein